MRRERLAVFVALVVTFAVSGCAAQHAPSASPQSMELSRTPMRELPVVQPPPTSPEVVEKDTTEAQEAIEAQRRAIESARPTPAPRPDLDLGVTQGIQQRNLNRSLGR